MSEKKEKNVIARVGNFVIVKESGNGMDWVSVKAISGFWTVRYREDNKMYGSLLMMAKHDDFRPYLENWITSLYVMANAVPDLDFYSDFLKAYQAMNDRMQEKHTDEEDMKALEEVRTMEEMKEEIEKEGGEESAP